MSEEQPVKVPSNPSGTVLATKSDIPRQARHYGVAFLMLLSVASGFVGGWLGSGSRSQQSQIDTSDRQQIILSESGLINDIAKNVGDSVVSINVTSSGEISDFLGRTQRYSQRSAGTGIILNEDGVIITNRHVVPSESTQVSVVLSDGTELDNVEVIGRTNETDPLDVAFLKIKDKQGKDLKPAELGDSSKVQVGDKVIAIGNALGQFQNTVTSGIISGYGRSIVAGDETSSETLQNLFQTDAAINQGNSGGPLVNIDGKVIGVNTAVAGGSAENLGFAIPINDIQGLIDSVLTTGKLQRAFLGIRYISLTDDLAKQLGVEVTRGAYIATDSGGNPSIVPGSPAAKAGLRVKDVITKINQEEVNEKNSLTSLVGRHKVGEEVTITVYRDGQYQEIKLTLEAQNQE